MGLPSGVVGGRVLSGGGVKDFVFKSGLSGGYTLRSVGALTSKPYAFTSRSWELKSTESVDIFDGVGCNVRVDTRGSEIMRVLPRLNEDVNEEWISDKSRFSYDGLKTQRLTQPMVKDKNQQLVPIGWDKARILLKHVVLQLDRKYSESGYEAHAVIGPYVDTLSAVKLRSQFLSHFSNPVFTVQEQPQSVSISKGLDTMSFSDLRHSYLLNTGLSGMENADLVLLVGSNPRYEAPLLNTRIRKAVMHHGAQVLSIGAAANLTYPHEHLGTSLKTLDSLIDGSHPMSGMIAEAERPAVLVSNAALQRTMDGGKVLKAVHALCKMYPKFVQPGEGWMGMNVVQKSANTVGLMELGFDDVWRGLRALGSETESPWKNAKFVFLMGADDIDGLLDEHELAEDCFVVYQGHHGDRGASRADLILPGAAYTEKAGIYVNMEGRVQQGKLAFFPPGHAREDAETISVLFGEDWLPVEKANAGLETLSPALMNETTRRIPIDSEVELSILDSLQSEYKSENSTSVPFAPPVDNFYMSDPITRASTTMAKCTRVATHDNFDTQ
eukprot:CAMPEP_0182442062 /NCGR_PEP_ID=MMETSP1172-20130603/1039_1 /TAXON_ID=708627 /ORGANISM="Timspurckia oligopyrenoides, Strain CCMP3278" /LENGTH=554 /DNA_ID=CAMNT_0024636753 /DNA_START=79 /DNA_END=1743 /DNA_ORIENTATION=-